MKYRDLPPNLPTKTVVLPPTAWATTYRKRPTEEVALGLRLLTEQELLTAHAQASDEASQRDRTGEARAFRFEEALVCWTLAAALCDPNRADVPYFERADDEIREAFPPDTLRHLWHQVEQAQVECSPVRPEITEEELPQLAAALPRVEELPMAVRTRVRRLLRFCLDELTTHLP